MQDGVTKRVLEIKRKYKLSQAEFADLIKVQRSSVSHMVNGRNRASVDVVIRLLQAYPELSADWLMRGTGKMFNEEADENIFEPADNEKKSEKSNSSLEKLTQNKESKAQTKEKEFETTQTQNKQEKDSSSLIDNDASHVQNIVNNKIPDPLLLNSSKQVVRVIIFYADKTFTDFRPE